MGIEPILSAWKAEVLAIIRMAHNSALDSLSAINKYGDNKLLLFVPICDQPAWESNPVRLPQKPRFSLPHYVSIAISVVVWTIS